MNANHFCRWVHRRLPLLAGGDLGVEERRKVERHLIGCPGCRGRRDSSSSALAALRLVAEGSPVAVDAPSLWPALARQIRQSRHATPPPSPWWALVPRPWALATLATGLGAVLAASIARTPAEVDVAGPTPPPVAVALPPAVAPAIAAEVPVPALTLTPSSQRALPEGPPIRPGELARAPLRPIEPPSSVLQFDYDLDHGTPMTPGNHDPQRAY